MLPTLRCQVSTLSLVWASLEMTRPRVVRDLLMLEPSFKLSHTTPVLTALSLPAKSTRLILLTWKQINVTLQRQG